MRLLRALALACLALGLVPAIAGATFPGRNGPVLFRSDVGNGAKQSSHAIWMVGADGHGAKRVTKGTYPAGYLEVDYSPVVFPDGRRFAYARQLSASDFSVENQIFVKSLSAPANAAGTPVLPAVDYKIRSLAVSPDGRTLAVAMAPPPLTETQIFSLPIEGGEMTQLTFPSGEGDVASVPDFSPDGSRIVFNRRSQGKGGLFSIAADGDDRRQLTSHPGDGAPSFSPSGARIVFNRHAGGQLRVFSMRANGAGATQLSRGPFTDRGPVFSPDGRSIVFSRSGDGHNPDLYAMRANGAAPHLFYASPGRLFSDFGPDWGLRPG